MNKITDIPIRSYAHIGDAVYELYVREKTIYMTPKPEKLHKITTKLVNAAFQADLLAYLTDFVTEKEEDIIRRARNLSVTTARRTNQKLHRLSTAFEALIGYLYLFDKERLQEVFKHLDAYLQKIMAEFKQQDVL